MRTKRQVEPIIKRYRALKELYIAHAGTSLHAWMLDRQSAAGLLDEDVERGLLSLIALKLKDPSPI